MDREYFERRAAEERDAAASAVHDIARDAHLELARRYEEMALGAAGGTKAPPPPAAAPESGVAVPTSDTSGGITRVG